MEAVKVLNKKRFKSKVFRAEGLFLKDMIEVQIKNSILFNFKLNLLSVKLIKLLG